MPARAFLLCFIYKTEHNLVCFSTQVKQIMFVLFRIGFYFSQFGLFQTPLSVIFKAVLLSKKVQTGAIK